MRFNKIFILVVILSTLFSHNAFANQCVAEECAVTQETFFTAFQRFQQMFPQVRFNADWNNSQPQAFASFRRLTVTGGFARKEDINFGGLITVICHEIGHALFSLNEGEADYYASNDCLKRYFAQEDNITVVSNYTTSTSEVVNSCANTFASANDIAICVRIAISGINAATADANRCLQRMEDLIPQVNSSNQTTLRVQEFYFRCLRSIPEIRSVTFRKTDLLTAAAATFELLSLPIDPLHEDQRAVTSSYGQHNSPLCRMQTLMNGNLNLPEPRCWKNRQALNN